MTIPQYGLAGANAALTQGIQGASQYGDAGIQQAGYYADPGKFAAMQQARFSGAMGPQAQQYAYDQFQSSPGQQWLQEQAERGLLRNSAAIGGLGGGNVRQALQGQAMGLAQQDFQNNFNRLGAVADRGLQATSLQMPLYQNMQNASTQLGRDKANFAYQAGQDIGNNYSSTTSALANLVNQQGAGQADMLGNYTSSIANLLAGAGGQQSASNQNLAALLANLATGSASNVAGLPGIPGTQERTGMLNNILTSLSGIPPKPTV